MMEMEREMDQGQAIDEFLAARRRGDEAALAKLRKIIEWEAPSLMAMKKSFGADHVRTLGYNTKKADKEYGPGWLGREN